MHAGHIDADARLKDLGIANKHLVAVARAMSIDAQIVIMDEPTAALSMKEIEELFLLIEFSRAKARRSCSSATSSTRSTVSPTATRCFATARWSAKA